MSETEVNWWQDLIVLEGDGDDERVHETKTDALLPRSDVTVARKIASRLPDTLSFGRQSGTWRVWDGSVHALDKSGQVEKILQAFCYTYRDVLDRVKMEYSQAAELAKADETDEDEKTKAYNKVMGRYRARWEKHRAFRDRLFSDTGQRAVLSQLKVHCAVNDELYDQETGFLVVRNGVIDISQLAWGTTPEDLALLPHDPRRRVTKMIPLTWNPHETAHVWDHYLVTALPSVTVREYLWKAVGSSLIGDPQHKAVFNLIGVGDSGKSVFIDTVRAVMGGYAVMAKVKVFLAKHGDSDFDRNALKGARFVSASEPGRGKRFDDEVLKSVSGRDIQRTDDKFEKATEWKPQCVIFIASNHPVKFDTTDAAFLQRIKPIRFPVKFVDDPAAPAGRRMDRQLENKLRAEHAGILNWLLEGLSLYFAEGLDEPAEVAAERGAMQTELEPVLEWAQELVEDGTLEVVAPGSVPASRCAKVSDLYALYVAWASSQGGDLRRLDPGMRAVSRVLQSRYGATVMSGGTRIPGLVMHVRVTSGV